MRWRPIAAVATIVALVAVAGVAVWQARTPQRRLVADFTKTVGIVAGSDVRILGVKIGSVTSVKPQGKSVRVEMSYDPTWDIPADAQAVIVPPSVVSDRYVQLTPAYNGGPKMADGAELPVSRTVVPLEIDDIYKSLDDFNKALGPDGANADGALSKLVATGAANLQGNGQNLHDALDGLSKAMTTLSNGRQDLFGSLVNLQQFTTALAESDQQVRQFNSQLADVSEQLAGERDELAAALQSLAIALAQVTSFVKDNREQLKSNVAALADVTGTLVRQQKAIVDILDVTPLALSNLNLLYNSSSGTLDTRDDAMGPYDPASYVCSLMVDSLSATQVPPECLALAQTLQAHSLPMTDQLRRLLGLPAGGGTPAAAGAPSSPVAAAQGPDVLPHDSTLGGILRGTK